MLFSMLFLAIAPRTILFIVLVLVLFFGAKRIPELFRGMGQGIREFKDASKEPQPEFRDRPNPNGYAGPGAPPQQGYTPNQPQNYYPPQPQQGYNPQPQQPPQPQNYTPNQPQA